MQILKNCEWDDATSDIRVVTRYSLKGADVLRYQSDQNRWFLVYPAASALAERWNQARETFADLSPQQCMVVIKDSGLFITGNTDQPTAHLALVPGTGARLCRLICYMMGFYPHDIEVTWEREAQVALGEQLTSGILPNVDPTFQIQVSIELEQEGASPTEHVCVVRHSSLGNTPLRVTWVPESQPPNVTGVLVIVAGCILAVLAVGALVCSPWKRPGA